MNVEKAMRRCNSARLGCVCIAAALSLAATSEPTTRPAATSAAALPPPSTAAAVTPSTQPTPVDERFAYAVGYNFGQKIRQQLEEQGRTADNGGILKGVIDGLDGHDSAYPPDQVQASVDQMHADALQREAEQRYATDPGFRGKADENAKRSQELLQQSASLAGVDVLPGGVQVRELKAGNGQIFGNAKSLTARYTVSLADGTKVTGSAGSEPVKLASSQLLPAVLDALHDMKCGATWRITLPPDKAYGLAGKPPLIGPNEALQIELELVSAE